MTVRLSLAIIGSDEEPRWAAAVRTDDQSWSPVCCDTGHGTPEDAASHGADIAAAWLARYVRDLEPPAVGALVLAGSEAC